jgi:hypothetical protein
VVDNGAGDLVLTYKALGDRLGISPDSARTKAKRRGWRVILDNQGLARVHVPPSELPDEPPERPARTEHDGGAAEGERGVLGVLSAELARALEDARGAHARADAAHASEVEIRVTLARTEAERDAAREALARERELIIEIRRELADARRPWWRRWMG